MSPNYDTRRLDVSAFARDACMLRADEALADFERLLGDAQGPTPDFRIRWEARGELRDAAGATPQVWLHLSAQARLPMTCQRCLELAAIEVRFERSFRFAADEAQAAALDEVCEEDVLVQVRDFNLHELVEDELLLALPLVPVHEVCPQAPKMSVADAAFVEEAQAKPNPFELLAGLKTGKI
ncbi:MAG: YceD family protein [Betaproteobacteria bacterium]